MQKVVKYGNKFYACDAAGKKLRGSNAYSTKEAAEARHERHMQDLAKWKKEQHLRKVKEKLKKK